TEAVAGLERTREILGERPEDEDPGRSVALGPIHGEVAFENVAFAYDAGKTVLEGITFTAEPGTVTALVGPSGAGKSTIIGLIAAFYVPTAGSVRVDGVDLATARLDSYRTQIGVVLQDTFLFDGTIRENVAFSRPDAARTRSWWWKRGGSSSAGLTGRSTPPRAVTTTCTRSSTVSSRTSFSRPAKAPWAKKRGRAPLRESRRETKQRSGRSRPTER